MHNSLNNYPTTAFLPYLNIVQQDENKYWFMLRPCMEGRGYIEARTDTTQQSGQTPYKVVEIKNITVCQQLH
jgi:hypothetical protein